MYTIQATHRLPVIYVIYKVRILNTYKEQCTYLLHLICSYFGEFLTESVPVRVQAYQFFDFELSQVSADPLIKNKRFTKVIKDQCSEPVLVPKVFNLRPSGSVAKQRKVGG
jgi:hypothetical protein